jgi:heme/copper-type cytochrome/quinol oxidase subunit 1
MTRNAWFTAAWIGAALLSAAGVLILIVGLATPAAFGWFAYQPLAHATFAPTAAGVFVSRTTIVGFILLAIGLIALAFLAGLRARRPRS